MTGESCPRRCSTTTGGRSSRGLLRDLIAREWLYYKVHGTQHVTPVAVMTSAAKGNHGRISKLMEDNAWFGRGKEAFRLFEQPLVPVVTTRGGAWVPEKDGELAVALKPAGTAPSGNSCTTEASSPGSPPRTKGRHRSPDHQPHGGHRHHHPRALRRRGQGGQGRWVSPAASDTSARPRGQRADGASRRAGQLLLRHLQCRVHRPRAARHLGRARGARKHGEPLPCQHQRPVHRSGEGARALLSSPRGRFPGCS